MLIELQPIVCTEFDETSAQSIGKKQRVSSHPIAKSAYREGDDA